MKKTNDSVDVLVAGWAEQRPDLDVSSLGLFGRLTRLSALLTKRAEQWLAPLELTWESFSLIVTLRRAGAPYELRPGELLAVSLLTSGAITNRIDRVETQGLVERHRYPDDRRGVVVRLTPAGRKLADKAIAVHLEQLSLIMAPLAPKDRKVADEVLSKLLASLETPAAPSAASRKSG
jgi:DNA-binding MarR family transcriptional regulator